MPKPKRDMLSIVIVNYNAGPLLAEGLRSLLNSDHPAREILLIDNASSDDSLQHLPPDARLRVLRNPTNRGFAHACNQGAALAMGDYLLFLNPDCQMTDSALTKLLHTCQTPNTGMAGPLILNPDGSEQRGCRRRIPDPKRAFHRLSGLHRLLPERFPDFNAQHAPLPAAPTPVEAISGACMMLPRTVFAEIGGWDDGYFLHAEDLDLCQRVQNAGYQILFDPHARIVHQQGSCSRGRPIWVEWQKHKGMWRFYKKFQASRNHPVFNAVIWLGIQSHFLLRGIRLALHRGTTPE